MKLFNTLLLSLLAFSTLAQKVENQNFLIFSGKIENAPSDTVSLFGNNQTLAKIITLDKSHSFRDTLWLNEGFYTLQNGQEVTKIYLKPNFRLHLTLDAKEFDETIKYAGKGSSENNYLAKKALLNESFGQLNYYGYYAKLDEVAFLNLTDSLYKVQNDLLTKSFSLDRDFQYKESKALHYNKLGKYVDYESMHRFVTGDREFKVSENYPDPFAEVNLIDEKLATISEYLTYIQSYLRKKSFAEIDGNEPDVDPTLAYVKTVKKEVKSKLLKEELLYKVGKWELGNAKDLDVLYNEIKPEISNTTYLNEITEVYTKLKKTQKGALSPLFELKDINGKVVSLKELRGKLVYIDVWATWCMPCIKEIPNLKALEETFKEKDIHFVSICIEDSEERWRSMVKEKNLGGIQLFAPTNDIPFIEDYFIQGIPRFILLDKNGKILDPNAKRPSDEELKVEIEKNL